MRRLLNKLQAQFEIAFYRTIASPGSSLALAFGVLVMVTTICALVVYSEGANMAILRNNLAEAHKRPTYDIVIQSTSQVMDSTRYQALQKSIIDIVDKNVSLPAARIGRHVWSKNMLIVPPDQSSEGNREILDHTRFQFFSDIQNQVDILSGKYPVVARDPQDLVEVMATPKLAQKLKIKVGDIFTVEDFSGASNSVTIHTRLAAIIQPKARETSSLYAPWLLDEALTVPEESFFNTIAVRDNPVDAEMVWAVNYDENAINIDNVASVLAGFDQLNFIIKKQPVNLDLQNNLIQTLSDYRTSTLQLKALMVLSGVPVIGIALYYITMLADLMMGYHRHEIALLKSRGIHDHETLNIFLLQGALIVAPAVICGLILSLPAALLVGKAETFLGFTGQQVIPVILRPQTFLYALGAGLLGLLAILLPTLRVIWRKKVMDRRETLWGNPPIVIHRYYLDVLVLFLGVIAFWMTSQAGSVITINDVGAMWFSPLLMVTLILLVTGLAFLMLRAIPYLFRLLARIDSYTDHVSSLCGLRKLAHSSSRYSSLVIILTFTLASGVFAVVVANAFNHNFVDQSMYAAGSDLRIHAINGANLAPGNLSAETYQKLSPDIKIASPAARVILAGREAKVTARGELLAIDLHTFSKVAWWRPDFTPSLDEILEALESNPKGLVMDAQTASQYSLKTGDTFDIDIDGKRTDFVLVGTAGYFPTLYPRNGSWMITRLDYLQDQNQTEPNEMWISVKPGRYDQVATVLNNINDNGQIQIDNGHSLAGVRNEDPLRTGLFGALSLIFLSASVMSILCFLLYASGAIQDGSFQLGVLRAAGLSVRQAVAGLATEQLSLTGLGVVMGILLGGGAGLIFVTFLQRSAITRQSVPSFVVTIPWLAIIALSFTLIGIFFIVLVFSINLIRKMRIYSVLQLGEQ